MLGHEIELEFMEFQLVLVPLCLFGGKFEFKELKAMLSSQGAHILISIIELFWVQTSILDFRQHFEVILQSQIFFLCNYHW